MYYGEEKKKQMVRSILPSTRSKWARAEQRRINKRNRRHVRHELAKALRDEDYREEGDFHAEPDFGYYVRERQSGDKLNPFLRWAEAITRDVPRGDRLSRITALLPANLIGWHAVSHVEGRDHFLPASERRNYWVPPTEKERDEIRAKEHKYCVRMLREIILDNRVHKLLHRWMKTFHRTTEWHVTETTPGDIKTQSSNSLMGVVHYLTKSYYVGPTTPRLLGGLGDIEDFLSDLKKARKFRWSTVAPYLVCERRKTRYFGKPSHFFNHENIRKTQPHPDSHPEWWHSLLNFLDLYEECRGEYQALALKVNRPPRRLRVHY